MISLKRIFTILAVSFTCFLFFSCSKPGDSFVQQAINAYSNQDYTKALELFNQALESDTNYSDGLILTFMSNIYAIQDDTENSILCLEKALSIKPDYLGYITLGTHYQNDGEMQKAEENFRAAIEINPEKAEALASMGILCLMTNRLDMSVEYLENAARIEPRLAIVHAYLAVAYAQKGEEERSNSELKLAEELKFDNIDKIKERLLEIRENP